jgi:gamma-glutamyltranspeptidase/glutathione hydrolase
MGAAPIAIAASREMNFLRISAIVAFVQTAKSFVSRPQLFLLSLCLAGLAGCGDPAPTVSDFGSGTVKGFGGAVAADEPRAVLVARDVLSGGGSAADAAVAAYFTLAVTLPSTAGLGGGGACLVHDKSKKKVEAILFLPQAASGGQVGLPLNARGMALLQARYGRMRWAQLLAPAEALALRGTAVSRALAREIATAGDKLRRDPELARIFVAADGHLLREGDVLLQPELGSVMSQLRIQGAGALYSGGVAARFVESANATGLSLTLDMLRGAVPEVVAPIAVEFGSRSLYFTPPPADGGLVTAELMALLTSVKSWSDASADVRPHLFAEASMRSFADRGHWQQPGGGSAAPVKNVLSDSHLDELMAGYSADQATPAKALNPPPLPVQQENPWAASFVTVDKQGNAVACNVTLNDLFGSGRMVPGTGIVLAPAPGQGGQDPYSLGPVMLASPTNGSFYFAAAASGGVTAATATAQVLLDVAAAKQPLQAAMTARRIHHNGDPDSVFHEPNLDHAVQQSLTNRGHQLLQADILGRVQAVWCPKSVDSSQSSCDSEADPRGDGLAVVLEEQ